MAQYTWIGGGGAFSAASMWTLAGATAMNPPGASDTADFANGGAPTGSGDVLAVSIEGATTFASGTVNTQSVNATAAVTVDSGGNLDSSGATSFSDDVTVQNGGQFESDFATFSGGSVTIDGDGSTYTDEASFDAQGTSDFTVSDGATVTTGTDPGDLDLIENGSLTLTSDATMTVADLTTFNGTTWSIDDDATLNAMGGGNLSGAGLVGLVLNGTGTVDGATIEGQAGFTVGGQGFEGTDSTGDATIADGADVSAGVLILGDYNGDDGTLTLTGDGTMFTLASTTDITGVPGTALIGNDGQGTLLLLAGAELDETCGPGGFASISYESDGTGDVTVDGEGSTWQIAGTLNVGDGGTGLLSVSNQGSVMVTALMVSAQSTSGTDDDPSLLTVDGDGSVMMVSDDATIDTATPTDTNDSGEPNGMCGEWSYNDSGTGQIIVADGGYVSIGGTLALQAPDDPNAPATVSVESGGSFEVGGSGGGSADTFLVDMAGLVIGHGTIAVDDAGDGSLPGGDLTNNGTVEAQSGTLVLNANVSGTGNFLIDTDATLQIGGTADASTVVTFGGGYDTTLALDDAADFAGVVQQYVEGDVIDLTQVSPTPPIRVTYGLDHVLTLQAISDSSGGSSSGEYDIKVYGTDEVPVFGVVPDDAGTGIDIQTVSLLTLLGIAFAVYDYDPGATPAVVTPAPINDYDPIMQAYPNVVGDDGFQAFAYQDDNDADCDKNIVIVFRGTYGISQNYWNIFFKNLAAGTSFVNSQLSDIMMRYITDAVDFVLKVHAANPDSPITLTGHSLGGALAQLVGYAAGLPVAAFNAPQFGQLYSQVKGLLEPVEDLGLGGSNVNYRLAGDIVSLIGTPLPGTDTFTVASPYPVTTPSLLIGNVLNSHGVSDPPSVAFKYIETDLTAGTAGQSLSFLQQTLVSNAVGLFGIVAANINYGADPISGSAFTVTETADSPAFSAIGLPIFNGVGSYDVRYETGSTWSSFVTIEPGSIDILPANVDGIEFDPLDSSGSAEVIPGSLFTLAFAASGTFSGTVTATGGTAAGVQASSGSLDLAETSSATPLGIAAPTDTTTDFTSADIGINVTALPANGTVYLADGSTKVTLGESLSISQLTGLVFAPGAKDGGVTSNFSYVASDPELSAASGSVALDVACFASGTEIATLRGAVPVEKLRQDDRVMLASGGDAAVVWLGHRMIDCERHPRPWDVRPVRIRAGAFGPAQPRRDLLLSPDHAVFAGGVLVPVRYLLNGASIVQEKVDRITYWHVELAKHAVLMAEDLPCESYLDTGNRGAFANGGAPMHLHPDFALRIWDAEACAPLVRGGPELAELRGRLLRRAGRLTRDPDVHLLADGVRIEPTITGALHRFSLRGKATTLRLVSRSAIPAEISRTHRDGRRLGLMLGRIAFFRPWRWQAIPLAEIPERRGFHVLESREGLAWRWTDGDAELPIPGECLRDGILRLEVQVLAAQPSWRTNAGGKLSHRRHRVKSSAGATSL